MTDVNHVAIVGGGPVGMGLALDLGQRGVSVVVVERENELHHIPKGQNLTQRTMETFRTWGVEDRVRKARIMPEGYPAAGVNAYGHLLSEYSYPWFRRSEVADFYFVRNERLPQYLTEQALRERVAELTNVEVRFGEAVTDVALDDDGATVTTTGGTIRAEYVVGCDGSHSTLRRAISIPEEIRDHDRKMVLLVFKSRELFGMLNDRFGEVAFFNVLHPDLDGYWRFLGAVDTAEEWFFHAPVSEEADRDTFEYESLLHRTVGTEFDVDLQYIGFWDLRVAIASNYRQGRAFLAGDSAHSHPPYGGFGINTGFEDARNLGWKLAAQIEGWGGAGLADSYNAERRPVFASTAADFIEGFIERDRQFIAANEPIDNPANFQLAWNERRSSSAKFGVANFAPHYSGSSIVVDDGTSSPSAVGLHTLKASPGHHLPPLIGDETMFDNLGTGFTLVTSASDGIVSTFEDAAANGQIPLTVYRPAVDITQYGTDSLLVRPDHFISWVDDGSPIEPNEVLATSVGH